jgi:carboxypeptidase C (cathepsin A)
MSKTVAVCLVVFLLLVPVVVGGIYYTRKNKDDFNITTDPLTTQYSYETMNCGKYPQAKRNGLNVESDNNIDICSFNKQFNSKTTFVEDFNTNPCSVTARQICEVLYADHQEYFTNMWSGLGECEVYQTKACEKCPNKLKIDKLSTYYPSSPNL